jgi:hypothetical protein
MSAFVRFPSLGQLRIPSFGTLDQLHFIATGEHMSPIPGDACPHPAEWYIKKTVEKQQRQRAYEYLVKKYDILKGSHAPRHVKGGVVNDAAYTSIQRGQQDEIILWEGTQKVMVLWPDGREEVDATPIASGAATPAQPFQLRAPPMARADTLSPVPTDFSTKLEIEIPPIRFPHLRKNYIRMLTELSDSLLETELEEWTEDMQRAAEHVAAIQKEIAARTAKKPL